MDIATERISPQVDIPSIPSISSGFPINATLLPLLLLSLSKQPYSPKTTNTVNTEYDYVIVGAGSAGSVVANRLSELSCVTVLLLEAGGAPPLYSEVPAFSRLLWYTDVDWQYKTVPQKHTGNQLVNRQVPWPSGKALGGSSIINAMLYVRGNRKNYDDWAAEGAEGWSYKDVLPYFQKMEDNSDPEYVASGYHNEGGPVSIQRPPYQAEIKQPIAEAAKSMGYRFTDINGARQTGFSDFQSFMRGGQRCSTAKAYLVPAENRTNLHILPNARVRKVVIKKRRAVGVQFDFQGKTYVVKARKEVILSAGTINTAQLLMLSGIGPKKELKKFKIPVIADLPVGKNMHDHCGVNINFELPLTIEPLLVKLLNPLYLIQYVQNRTGPYAASEFISELAFLNHTLKNPKVDSPNYQLYFVEGITPLALQDGITPLAFLKEYAVYTEKPWYFCVSHALQPRSRGTVTLNSADPYDPPVIDPNYFDDPKDIDDTVDGLKTCNRIGNSLQMKKLGSVPFRTLMPGCEKFVDDEDLYFRCLVRAFAFTMSHEVGTARMGRPEDPRTVVDPQLRVKHIKGLRVVDASVMPIIPSGNTNAPTIMVAEKASDIIKKTIKCHHHTRSEESSSDTGGFGCSEEKDNPVKLLLSVIQSSEPDIMASEPDIMASEPDIKASEPDIKASEPDITGSEPDIKASAPDITASAPDITVTKPDITVTEPDITVSEPANKASDPDITVTEPGITVTKPDITVTEPDITVTEPDITVTESGISVTEPDITVTEPDITVTEPGSTVTKPDRHNRG